MRRRRIFTATHTHSASTITPITPSTIGSTTASTLVLPRGSRRISVRWNDMPWVGIYHPKLTVRCQTGCADGDSLTVRYPTLVVLPPWWVLVLIAAAIALPIARSVRRHRRGRGR